ncbi:nucleic acid-binding, OB-fold protein [Vibrio phage 1.228.O._10N.261.49.C1]|nr:nucleic acid-binding, OB-fold protein [Vibrio phage 1.157.O._10N.261.45.B7]AUR96631.1 nucleic acid-binding, OB-fold protein [Vibrio phage 1.228.O._10N.261.49.C1]
MFSKLVRIGQDATLKYTPTGTAILEINAVYDIGFGDKKESQWIRLAMFGKRAEKLQSHFTKGTMILVHADDIKARAYMTKSGEPGCSLEGNLVVFRFSGGGQQQQQQQYNAPQQQQAPQQQYNQPPADFDDGIPFVDPYHRNSKVTHCM